MGFVPTSGGGGGASSPGFEIYYAQVTVPVAIVATAEGTPTTIIAGAAIVYSNVPYMFEFFAPGANTPSPAGTQMTALLMQDGVSIGRIGTSVENTGTGSVYFPFPCRFRFTPTAGSHTFGIAGFASNTTGAPGFLAGVGGVGAYVPMYIRATVV